MILAASLLAALAFLLAIATFATSYCFVASACYNYSCFSSMLPLANNSAGTMFALLLLLACWLLSAAYALCSTDLARSLASATSAAASLACFSLLLVCLLLSSALLVALSSCSALLVLSVLFALRFLLDFSRSLAPLSCLLLRYAALLASLLLSASCLHAILCYSSVLAAPSACSLFMQLASYACCLSWLSALERVSGGSKISARLVAAITCSLHMENVVVFVVKSNYESLWVVSEGGIPYGVALLCEHQSFCISVK
ncbi:hypothetical protein Tco_0458113 [Tanacetum coccineum]